MLEEWLDGEAGQFGRGSMPVASDDQALDSEADDRMHIRFAVGVAATGNATNISGRLFRDDFEVQVGDQVRDRPLPQGLSGYAHDHVVWSQDALTWRHEIATVIHGITIIRAAWDGSVAIGVKRRVEDIDPDRLAAKSIAPEWRYADELVEQLGGFGDVYATVVVAGFAFPRRTTSDWIVMRRGPMLTGVSDDQIASLGRELQRAAGSEPSSHKSLLTGSGAVGVQWHQRQTAI